MNRCSWCDSNFIKDHPQQIYCSVQCRTEASKESARRYAKIAKYKSRRGKTRLCKSCQQPLSIYNDSTLCRSCEIKDDLVKKALKNIKDFINHEGEPEQIPGS